MSEFFSNFHFIRPLFLLALIPSVLLGVALLRQQQKAVQWQTFIAPHLLKFLVDGSANKLKRLPIFALICLWSLAALALAGPAWTKLPQPVHKEASALVIVWDLSPSMKAGDLNPSRVVRSRLKLFDLLNNRKEGVTALVAYSGEAHVVTPLTDDTATISSLLNGLNPDIMPVTGSNVEMALETAITVLKDGGITKGDILFVTDGIAFDAAAELSGLAKAHSHRITVWGIGTTEGAPIPGRNGGFLKNNQGEIIISKIDDKQLSEAATAMGGAYIPFTNNDFDLKSFQALTANTLSNIDIEASRTFDKWYEHGPYLLLAILPLAAFAFRRGFVLSIVALGFGLALPSEKAYAFGWKDLWETKDQQAYKALQEGDAESAAQTFKDPQWKGVADYKSENYEGALEQFSQDASAESLYNQGNALAHLDKYQEAKEAYQKALALQPDFEAAKQNLAIVEQLEQLNQSQQQQNQQSQNQDGEQQDQQQGDQQQNNNNAQQSQNGEDSEQGAQNQEQANNSQQQNNSESQENTDTQNPQQQSEQDSKSLSEEQKQALENQYGQQQQKENNSEEESGASQKDEEQAAQEQEAKIAQQPGEQGNQNEEAENAQAMAMLPQNSEQNEEQQALEQWLRKVPDDPSGLLRNKFKYESRERRLELRSGRLRSPEPTEQRL